MQVTVKQAREFIARIPSANLCASDDRVVDLLNEARLALVMQSHGADMHQKVRLCVNEACIVLPRQIASITDASVESTPIPVRNQWWEMLPQQNTHVGQVECRVALHDDGRAISFDTIRGVGKALQITTDQNEDAGTHIWLYGTDANGNWIRTVVDGELVDGMRFDLSLAPITTPPMRTWTRSMKDVTKGNVRIFEETIGTGSLRALAVYEYDETHPEYRKYRLSSRTSASCAAGTTLTAMAKLEFLPVRHDNDIVIPGNLLAIKDAVLSILKKEANDMQGSTALLQSAGYWQGRQRDHYSPKEHTAISMTAVGGMRTNRRRIGRIR